MIPDSLMHSPEALAVAVSTDGSSLVPIMFICGDIRDIYAALALTCPILCSDRNIPDDSEGPAIYRDLPIMAISLVSTMNDPPSFSTIPPVLSRTPEETYNVPPDITAVAARDDTDTFYDVSDVSPGIVPMMFLPGLSIRSSAGDIIILPRIIWISLPYPSFSTIDPS